jgi:hypothetical protein
MEKGGVRISLRIHCFVGCGSGCARGCSEVEVEEMLGFLVDGIYVVVGGKVFRRSIGVPMGADCAPLLADLFLYSYEAEFVRGHLREKRGCLVMAFGWTFRYIDDVLSITVDSILVSV